MKKALLVAAKEIKGFLADRADLAYSFLLPIFIFALMYGAFGGHSSFSSVIHIVNSDPDGEYSKRLLEKLHDYSNLEVKLLDAAAAEKKLNRSDITMAFIIPADFSSSLGSQKKARLVFRQRGNGGFEEQIVMNLVRGAAEEIAQEFRVINQVTGTLAGMKVAPETIRSTVRKFSEREKEHPLINVDIEDIGNRPDPVNNFLPGVLSMFVLFALSLNSRVLVEERKKGTLERLMTTQLKVDELFAGKFLANVGRGFIQVFILLSLAYLIFHSFTPVSFLLVILTSLIFCSTAGAFGLLISSIARTEDQAIWFGVVITIIMVMLGSTFFAVAKGSLIHQLGQFSINTHANEAYRLILSRSGTLTSIGRELLTLAGITAGALILSRILFKYAARGR